MLTTLSLNRVWLVFLFVSSIGWLLCTAAPAQSQSKPGPEDKAAQATEIKTLLKERRALLKRVGALMADEYASGRAELEFLLQHFASV